MDNLAEDKTKKLDDYAIQSLQKSADESEELARIVTRYSHQNRCPLEEAHKLAVELRQLASILRQCNSVYDFELVYKAMELFTFQLSRFQHKRRRYCWDNLMRINIINKLSKCKYSKYKSNNLNSNEEEIPNEINSGLKPFSRHNKWGYKDSNDNIVIKPTFDYAWDFTGNLAKVKKEVWGSYKYGLINSQGDIVLPIEYYSIEPFCEGMARITQESWGNYQYGFINDEGNLVIPLAYDYAESFNNGIAKVTKKNRSFYIDKKGNKVD